MKSLSKAAKSSSVTPAIYNEIGDFFRSRFGPLAGWAHTVLFAAELHDFKKVMSGEEKLSTKIEAAEVEEKVPEVVKREMKRETEVKQEDDEIIHTKNKKRKRKITKEKSSDDDAPAPIKMEPEESGSFLSAADRVKSRKRQKRAE